MCKPAQAAMRLSTSLVFVTYQLRVSGGAFAVAALELAAKSNAATAKAPPDTRSWYVTKTSEVDSLIAACAGLHIESSTTTATVSGGQALPIKLEAINRSGVPVQLLQ